MVKVVNLSDFRKYKEKTLCRKHCYFCLVNGDLPITWDEPADPELCFRDNFGLTQTFVGKAKKDIDFIDVFLYKQ